MVDVNSLYQQESDAEEVLHSHAMARSGRGDKLGSTSTETFEGRKAKERLRSVVKGYGYSKLGHTASRERYGASAPKRPIDKESPSTPPSSSLSPASRRNRISGDTPPVPRHSFKEPNSRGYNPFG